MARPDHNGRLLIGVTSKSGDKAWVEENTRNYLQVLEDLGATGVVLAPDKPTHLPSGAEFAPNEQGRLPDAVLDCLDGLVLAGGGDVHPKYFQQAIDGADPDSIDVNRDELELSLARAAAERDLTLFGICRGCQVLNVALGGGMVQHLDNHRSSKRNPVLHTVNHIEGTMLRSILGKHVDVNTYHHQGVDAQTLAPCLVAAGTAAKPDDWLIESFESPEHQWLIGVQWHPERLFELPSEHVRLWQSFLTACGR